MKTMNNHVLIDIGRYGTHHTTHDIGGKSFTFDVTYNGYEYLRRSGKVLSVPQEFVYIQPFNMEHRLKHIRVQPNDSVFFDAAAFAYCSDHNLIERTPVGKTTYLMPYKYLICAVKHGTEEVQMLNGKVLVKMRQDLMKNPIFAHPEITRTSGEFRYAEIVKVDNNEGYEGIGFDLFSYEHFAYSKQDLKVGDIVIINKYADFDLQSIFQEVTTHNELDKTFVVDRAEIVCFRDKDEEQFNPYGFYLNISRISDDNKPESTFVLPKKNVAKIERGEVLGIGCAVPYIPKGYEVLIKEKSSIQIGEQFFCHKMWLNLSES